jgi:hypothetical protein
MQILNVQEFMIVAVLWLAFVVLSECLNEIVRTATPLEGARAFLSRRSKFISSLLSCGYCTSVWIGFSLGWILPPILPEIESLGQRYLTISSFINTYLWWFVNGLLLHRLSNYLHDRLNKRRVYRASFSENEDGIQMEFEGQ